jgi:hypothetical protein
MKLIPTKSRQTCFFGYPLFSGGNGRFASQGATM